MRKQLSKKDSYLNDLFFYESNTLKLIKDRLVQDNKWGINIGYHEISLLSFYIKQFNIKNVLEVGTLYGFSTYAIASQLPDNGSVTSLEKDNDNFKVATELLGECDESSKIEIVNTDASTYMKNCDSKFDLIFIDANKSSYLDYLKMSLALLSPGGMVIGDNTFLFGHVYDQGVMNISEKSIEAVRNFNKELIHNSDYQVTMIPTTEGMTVIKKNH